MKRVLAASTLCLLLMACDAKPQTVTRATAAHVAVGAAKPAEVAAHHCEGSPVECQENAAPPVPHPVSGGQLYGAALDQALDLTPLSSLLASPAEFAGRIVRTTGVIGRVCQHRGCWMELRVEENGTVARVPMAGHAFFVPSDSTGRTATVQGAVSVRDGNDNPVRIDATAVLIADSTP
jgi:hypothetical protein